MADIPKHAVIFCHPRRDSFNGAVADAYRAAVEEIGHEVCLRDLYRMGFDPVLKDEERPGEPGFHLHADVEEELRILSGARVFVLIYPIWFGTPPAMLKGYVERVFGSGFSHRDMREQHQNRLLSGGHLLSLTSSGNTRNWLDEQAQWLSLRDVFDHYLKTIFSMKSDEHVHFAPINDQSPARFIEENMEQVRAAARIVASKASSDMYRRATGQLKLRT
jgi:NAD(P)H dehydrogenase (quinone)